jgi:hypothetical protein
MVHITGEALKLEEAIELIEEFAKLRYKKKFHGKAIIIWKDGKVYTVEVCETHK